MSSSDQNLPGISIVLAIRNEAEHLHECLQAIVSLDYPRELLEILLVDGMSTDGTRAIIDRWSAADPRFRLLENQGRIVSTGMNLALRSLKYDLLLWSSGHTLLQQDHLRRCLQTMNVTGAAAVGGVLQTVGRSFIGRINAAVLSSPFGVGNARHRIGGDSGWVPAVTMALYRKAAISAAGGFDENLPRSQDNELHGRMNRLGSRSYLDASIRPVYLCRETFAGLLRQAWANGYAAVMLTRLKARGLSLRHFAPLAMVLALLLSSAAIVVDTSFWPLAAAITALYLLADLGASIVTGLRRRLVLQIPLLFLWYPALHLTYGLASCATCFARKPTRS